MIKLKRSLIMMILFPIALMASPLFLFIYIVSGDRVAVDLICDDICEAIRKGLNDD